MNDWKKKAKPKAESANPASISVPTWANFQILKGAAPEAFASTDQVSLNAFKTYLLNQNWVVTDEHHSPAFDLLARRGDELLLVETKTPKFATSWDSLLGQAMAYGNYPNAKYAIVVPSSSAVHLSEPSYLPPSVKLFEVNDTGEVVEHQA